MPLTMNCPACGTNTSVRPPLYRCDNCNYPLKESRNMSQGQAYSNRGQHPPIQQAAYPPANVKRHENERARKQGRNIAGWLILHMKDKQMMSYELYEGENVFGRPSAKYHSDIPIDDGFVSRAHANIVVEKDLLNRLTYSLLDDGAKRNGRPSGNGTFLNAIRDRIPKTGKAYLRDGDTIQVGFTTLVFKSIEFAKTEQEAVMSLAGRAYVEIVK